MQGAIEKITYTVSGEVPEPKSVKFFRFGPCPPNQLFRGPPPYCAWLKFWNCTFSNKADITDILATHIFSSQKRTMNSISRALFHVWIVDYTRRTKLFPKCSSQWILPGSRPCSIVLHFRFWIEWLKNLAMVFFTNTIASINRR